MESVHCRWSGTNGQPKQPFPKPRHLGDTLSRLAVLMARVDHRPEGRSQKSQQSSSPSISKASGKDHIHASDMSSVACSQQQQQKERTLRKPHHCQHCGQKFSLASTLQMHRCHKSSSTCQVCRGKLQKGTTCSSCPAKVSSLRSSKQQPYHFNHRRNKHDGNPYACAPCGKAFSHKQELLYHQQGAGCQPAPSTVTHMSTDDTPTPSYASIPPSTSGINHKPVTCPSCHKTFRTAQGLSCHQRIYHQNSVKKNKKKVTQHVQGSKGTLFACRSCDKVFPQTSMLYRHRKEEHRRKTSTKRQQRSHRKRRQSRQRGETYPCLHCGKVFLHHLTRWAHFKSYSSHYQTHLSNSAKSDKTQKASETSKDLKTTKGSKLTSRASKKSKPVDKKTNKHVKKCFVSKNRRQEIADKEDARTQDKDEDEDEDEDEDGEFPCPSCEEVFTTKSALLHHEDIHQSTHTPNHCSVCTGGIALPQIAGSSVNRVYHCVPCKEAYVDLDTFLQHCQTHFYCSNDDEKDDDAQLSD
ncbi:oocyte zinc finger protein XlCOF6 [Astyanax mexicanus]|uniref:oocyte zinc finger protein XlCOF6 n=1 Tax=Astyanax mexicanus TaxID=7994 RepID=UPI0020CB6984|nr:oocyte zinc finger protein XlCOF6 [Astyanax mexicanus]